MSSSVLEIVELANGDIILRHADSQAAPLLTIKFSDESRQLIADDCISVAKAMIQAGIEAAAEIVNERELIDEDIAPINTTVH